MPKSIQLKDFTFEPGLLLQLARLFANEEGTCLLHSGGPYDSSRFSYLCLFPFDFIYLNEKRQWRASLQSYGRHELEEENPWNALKLLMPNPANQSLFPEWVGFLTYEMGAYSDHEKIIRLETGDLPLGYFQRCALTIQVDHQKKEGSLFIADQAFYLLQQEQIDWIERLSNIEQWKGLAPYLSSIKWDNQSEYPDTLPLFESKKENYISKIEEAKEWIKEGNIYQVNLSQSFTLKNKKDPYHLFLDIIHLNPAPFSAYFRFTDKVIISSSPERFLKLEGEILEARPIKGTIPRGKSPSEDLKNKEALATSVKDNAELLMITDLMRNDLGKISLPGSVKTPELAICESYANVFHLLSIIRSKIQPNLNSVDVIRACFPGGSVTGCPKLSAIEAIAKLEKRSRGIYTGSIGYFAGNGDFDFNIAIRTIVQRGHEVEIQLGGAIVADSNPLEEYLETLYKGESIFKALLSY